MATVPTPGSGIPNDTRSRPRRERTSGGNRAASNHPSDARGTRVTCSDRMVMHSQTRATRLYRNGTRNRNHSVGGFAVRRRRISHRHRPRPTRLPRPATSPSSERPRQPDRGQRYITAQRTKIISPTHLAPRGTFRTRIVPPDGPLECLWAMRATGHVRIGDQSQRREALSRGSVSGGAVTLTAGLTGGALFSPAASFVRRLTSCSSAPAVLLCARC